MSILCSFVVHWESSSSQLIISVACWRWWFFWFEVCRGRQSFSQRVVGLYLPWNYLHAQCVYHCSSCHWCVFDRHGADVGTNTSLQRTYVLHICIGVGYACFSENFILVYIEKLTNFLRKLRFRGGRYHSITEAHPCILSESGGNRITFLDIFIF